jgi:hypothetical protein
MLVYLNFDYVQQAAHKGLLLPLAGFVVLPLTVLAYALLLDVGQATTSVGYLLLMMAIAIDLGSLFIGTANRMRE